MPRRRLSLFLGLLIGGLPHINASAEIDESAGFSSWVDMRDEGIVKQSLDYSCGPAAMATMLSQYFQIPSTEQEVLSSLEASASAWELPDDWRETGVSMAVLAKIANSVGLEAIGIAVELSMLTRLNVPAIVYLEHRGFPHFSVVRGVDHRGRVQLADPSWGNQLLSQREFEKLWLIGASKKGKLLLLRPQPNSNIVANSDYFAISSRTPLLRQIN